MGPGNGLPCIYQRQREGIATAAAAGKYKQRALSARAKADEAHELVSKGGTREAAARTTGMGVASVCRIFADKQAA